MTDHHFTLPTYEELCIAYALVGRSWRGGPDGQQAQMAKSMTTPGVSRWIGQVCRQAFKTETSALYNAVAVMKGGHVGLGMPAQNQAAVVKRKRTLDFLDEFERLGLIRRKGTGHPFFLSEWLVRVEGRERVGSLAVVGARAAMNQLHRKSTQTGRTFDILDLDEGQSLFSEDVAELDPSIAVAEAEGHGRLNVVGVGGPMESIIESRKSNGYTLFWCNDEMFLAENPMFAPVFDQMRADNTDEWCDANLGCLPLAKGKRILYPDMHPPQPLPAVAGSEINVFGIDVGRTRDYTLIAHMIWHPAINRLELREFKQIPHGNLIDQARHVYEYIDQFAWICDRHQSFIACETNGIGYGLHDTLVRLHEIDSACAGFPYLTKFHVQKDSIHGAVQDLRVKMRDGVLQIHADARTMRLGDPPKRLDELTFTINERGDYKYEHHDGHSALLIANMVLHQTESA